MSSKILQERLDGYHCQSEQEETNALKEILQEIALASLSRSDFFKRAAFQGGTCLRILHSLDRFSEDLDFILNKADPGFAWDPYQKGLQEEFQAYGVEAGFQSKSEAEEPVQKMFLKDDSLVKILILKHRPKDRRPAKIRIKFEIDINPPGGSCREVKFSDFPFSFAVTTQDLSSLFAGKCHALLCRAYMKGRDWYDYLWYVSRKVVPNYEFLSRACEQQGSWKEKTLSVDKGWLLHELEKKVSVANWEEARNEVGRFLKPRDQKTLEVWSKEFFLDRLNKMRDYL